MKERPILFSGPMVRAIFDGRKTQTRRAVKHLWGADHALAHGHKDRKFSYADNDGWHDCAAPTCPYGEPGERLWVREAWARTRCLGQEMVVFRTADNRTDYGGPWKPGIHLRRADARLVLEIEAVRVERVRDITEEDARAEGVRRIGEQYKNWPTDGPNFYTVELMDAFAFNQPTARDCFSGLWEHINGLGSWDANPWVWVIQFRPLQSLR